MDTVDTALNPTADEPIIAGDENAEAPAEQDPYDLPNIADHFITDVQAAADAGLLDATAPDGLPTVETIETTEDFPPPHKFTYDEMFKPEVTGRVLRAGTKLMMHDTVITLTSDTEVTFDGWQNEQKFASICALTDNLDVNKDTLDEDYDGFGQVNR